MVNSVKIFAHRGASATFAENTRAAFAHALTVGAHGIETDVQLSADDHLICWHDTTVDRTSNGRGPVRGHTLDELRELDVHSWKSAASTLSSQYGTGSNQLMTLDELTEMLFEANRPVELALEMKISDGNERQIAECIVDWLQRWGWDPDSGTLGGATSQVSLSVMSFSLTALDLVASDIPDARLCPLFSTKNRGALQIGEPGWHGPDQLLGPSVGWLSRYEAVVKSWLAAGRTLRMWTIETEQQLRRIQRLGIQQVTVNDPVWALQYLNQQQPDRNYIHRLYHRLRGAVHNLGRRTPKKR